MPTSEPDAILVDLLTARAGHLQTRPPDELVQAVSRLGLATDALRGHATEGYDDVTGASSWQVTLATDSALIEVTAAAVQVAEPYGNGEKHPTYWSALESNARGQKMYTQPPEVSVRVRPLKDLADLTVIATGATDAWEGHEMVRETWTFTFRDGTDPVVFEIDHSNTERPTAVDDLCQHLAAHL